MVCRCDAFLTEKVRRRTKYIGIRLKGDFTNSSKELIIQKVE